MFYSVFLPFVHLVLILNLPKLYGLTVGLPTPQIVLVIGLDLALYDHC